MNQEQDPTGRSAKDAGAKLDAGKPPVRQGVIEYFPRALLVVAQVSAFGAAKYSWGGWGPAPDGVTRYGNAMDRHALYAAIEGATDSASGLPHAAHEAWNALARLELMLREQEQAKAAPAETPEPWPLADPFMRRVSAGGTE